MSSETIDELRYVLQNVRLQSGDIWQKQVNIVTEAIEKISTLESVISLQVHIMPCDSNLTKEKGVAMNSAQLVNLILEKLRRVEFVEFTPTNRVKFIWGDRIYEAVEDRGHISVVNVIGNLWVDSDNYNRWVEGVLNGKKRDADGNLS